MAVTLLLGACVGTLEPIDGTGDDAPDPTGSVARQMFDAEVSPLLLAACAGCHVGATGTAPLKFLGNAGVAGYYPALIGQPAVIGSWNPAEASLLTKGAHSTARAWTPGERDAIAMWLIAEASER
jgi:hypothetical protein